jgi:CRISPR-associated endonuclease/helicase Cas3
LIRPARREKSITRQREHRQFGEDNGCVPILRQDFVAPAMALGQQVRVVLQHNVTTTVQLLETLFGAGTRGARRMHQLAKAILVFDEIQTLPVKCVHMFNNAMNFLVEQCGSTVVLCTATQPLLGQVDEQKGAIRLNATSEIMDDVAGLFEKLARVEILDERKAGGWRDEEVADLAIQEVRSSGSCLVVVNTKAAARNLYRLCKEVSPELPIYHLSTNMCPAHRKTSLSRIRELLKPGSGVDPEFETTS